VPAASDAERAGGLADDATVDEDAMVRARAARVDVAERAR
jgi:hypothetical protein